MNMLETNNNERTKINQFYEFLKEKNFSGASKLACAEEETLRSRDVVESIKTLFSSDIDGKNDCLQYFIQLSNEVTLNECESIEFCRIASLRQQQIENMVKNKKLTVSDNVASIIKSIDPVLAFEIYNEADNYTEVLNCLVMSEKYDKIQSYMKIKNFIPDYMSIFNILLENNKHKACEFVQIFLEEDNQFKDYDKIIDAFLKHDLVHECTSFLMELLKNDKEDDSRLQTKLIEINLLRNPEIAEFMLANHMFSHFDRPYIASLCEKCGLTKQALELYELYVDFESIKRILTKPHLTDSNFILNYFGLLEKEKILECLKGMLMANKEDNLHICVQIASFYRDKLTVISAIELFKSMNSDEGIFNFLNKFIDSISSQDILFEYLKAACKIDEIKEVERICKENNYFDANDVKNLLIETNNSSYNSALITTCIRFNLVHDLILHFCRNGSIDLIDSFIKNNPVWLPHVIGALAHANSSQVLIIRLITSFVTKTNLEDVVREVEKYEKLYVLREYLEDLVLKGSKQAFVHTALAKIYIKIKFQPEMYLKENRYYISRIIGNYCEKNHPNLALIAYSRGNVDDDVIRICLNNNMLKELVDYLIKRDKFNIWTDIFSKKNMHWRKILDFFIFHSVYGSYNKMDLITATKAVLISEIKHEFIDVLDHSVPKTSVLYEIAKEFIE